MAKKTTILEEGPPSYELAQRLLSPKQAALVLCSARRSPAMITLDHEDMVTHHLPN